MNTNVELQNLSNQEMKEINGGDGQWHWQEALYCAAIAGVGGVIAYTIGTMQKQSILTT